MTVENVRLSRPACMRIERDKSGATARVFVNGEDVSHHVTAVTWTMRAGKLPTATVTFHDVDINAGAEDVDAQELVGIMAERPDAPRPITREQWERLREFAPGLVDAIEQARPVVARDRVVNRDSGQGM